ncbi:hypothetical protein O6H91_07G126300 [Diphasiastrum complanatum]|uniref:Uncharacterized protein n=2 Tax=Diphasiastrum complanatum TaxID=34168 RepID=A0ACC2D9B4_DIPCM|nr:hypothetical protein O6H91_07G126300 [Diphasiastrum complanatum]KAJ7550949.1 hypothetical protein O6H91_07G126300 [Diphasiastrum complanatum]
MGRKMLHGRSTPTNTASPAKITAGPMSNPIVARKDHLTILNPQQEGLESRLFKPSPGFFIDDYNSYHEGRFSSPYVGLVGGIPSQAEAEEAARQLRATFVYGDENADGLNKVKEENQATQSFLSSERCYQMQELEISRRQWESTFSDNCQSITACGGGAVAKCVELFQRSPDVQNAVMSLVKDPAIWNAFVANEKVQQLMQKRNTRLSQCGELAAIARDSDFGPRERVNPLEVALSCAKNVLWDAIEAIVDIVHGIFGFVDRKMFGEANADPLDHPIKACMVLTILILALIVFDRRPRVSKSCENRTNCGSAGL